jgi:chemotaxis methyl-accepting protein methylase
LKTSKKPETGMILPLELVGVENRLSTEDQAAFQEIVVLARELTGVQLSDRHQAMIASRLGKRISELGLGSLADYLVHFRANRIEETPKLVSLITTHHTFFFREFSHFDFLQTRGL